MVKTRSQDQETPSFKKIYESIIILFSQSFLLLLIAFISLVTNVWLAKPGQEWSNDSIIIAIVLVLISGGVCCPELRSDKATTNLSKMIVIIVKLGYCDAVLNKSYPSMTWLWETRNLSAEIWFQQMSSIFWITRLLCSNSQVWLEKVMQSKTCF